MVLLDGSVLARDLSEAGEGGGRMELIIEIDPNFYRIEIEMSPSLMKMNKIKGYNKKCVIKAAQYLAPHRNDS